jgi:adenylate cyclase
MVDEEPDFEALLKQRFPQQIRSGDYAFRFARHGEETLIADCITSNWRM